MEVGARDVQGLPPWHSQPLDRVAPPWLANPRPPAMSPHANGTRHPSHWFNSGRIKGGRDGGKRMIPRLNEENGRQENTVPSTWKWCKQGWPRLSQTTDRWPRPRSLLLTVLNILFNLDIYQPLWHLHVQSKHSPTFQQHWKIYQEHDNYKHATWLIRLCGAWWKSRPVVGTSRFHCLVSNKRVEASRIRHIQIESFSK